jgi:hypothetical protein
MAQVTYIGPFDQIAVPTPAGDVVCKHGETIDLPDDIVHGTPAEGDPPTIANGFHSPGYRPGVGGLVDQTTNWSVPAKKTAARKKTAQPTTTTASDLTEES